MKTKIYYANTGIGCTLLTAVSLPSAKSKAMREVGTRAGVKEVRLATEQDIAWVRGMGGRVPKITAT